MTVRHVARTVGVSLAIACVGALSTVAFGGVAGATGPANGAQVATAAPQGSFTSGTPFSSGQVIAVNVPANTVFPQSTNIVIEECSAPNGVVPTLPTACDSNTVDSDTIFANGDGSVSYNTYPVYALPDFPTLGEGSSAPVKCGSSAATECVLYVGTQVSDFTQPHFFSQPFQTAPDAGDAGTNPGDGTPEVPLAVGLPLAAAGVMGGLLLHRRRHAARSAS